MVRPFISHRLDYCNAPIRIPSKRPQRLERIQNSYSISPRSYAHSSGFLSAPGLDIRFPPLTCQCIYGHAPLTSKNFSTHKTQQAPLIQTSSIYPEANLVPCEINCWCTAVPHPWNALPDTLRAPQSYFKRGLKTFLFNKTFDSPS